MYATNRQSRSALMSAPRVHWANWLGIVGLLRSGLRGAAENVARVNAEQQREDQHDQSGAAAYRDLPATASSSAAHLRRVELGSLVVFHVSPTASS